MTRITEQSFIMDSGCYRLDVMVCIDMTDEAVYEKISRYSELTNEEKEALKMDELGSGRTVHLQGGQTIIRLIEMPIQEAHEFIAHEIFHAAEFILNRVGIKHDRDISGEAFAYLIQHLTKQFYFELK